MKLILTLTIMLALSGCSTMLTGSLCTIGPFHPDKGASQRFTRSEKEYVVSLNESGAKVCGWKP